MNKYTLQFIDPCIERHYRIQTINNTQYPTFKLSTILGLIFYLILLLFQLLVTNVDTSKIFIRVISIVIIIITFIIVRKKKHLVNLGLLLLNCVYTLLEWEKDEAYDNYNGYYYGGNTMIIHTLMMFPQNFEYSLASNIIIFVARSVITSLYVQIIYLQLVLGIGTTIGFSILLYTFEKFQRESYLLNLKDDSWEKMLPLILTKPFLMFSFDFQNFSYKLKQINKLDFQFSEEKTVSQFLNDAKYKGQTLQEYIYNQIIKKQQYQEEPIVQSLIVNYQRSKINLLVSYCNFGQPNFIIVLQSEDNEIKKIKKQFDKQQKSYLIYFQNYMQTTCKIMQKSIQQNSFINVFKLMISNRENLLFSNKNNQTQQNINVTVILQKICYQLKNFNYQVNIQLDANIEIITIKSYLLIFFYEIFKVINLDTEYFIRAFLKDGQLMLTLIGLIQLPETSLFQHCQHCLIEQTIKIKETTHFIFQKLPNISFTKVNFSNILQHQE